MIKLYFKKVFLAFLLISTILSAYFVSYYICYIITHSLNIGSLLSRAVSIIITIIFNLIFWYRLRLKNIANREKYVNNFTANGFSIGKDIIHILKSKDYIAENLALLTLILPLFLYGGIAEKTPFLPFVIGTLILIIISVVSFSIVDISIWLLIHKNWRKFKKKI